MGRYFCLVWLVEIAVTTCSQVNVQQANSSDGIVDLTSEDPIVLSWNSSEVGAGITHVALKLHILDSSDQDPTSVDGVTIKFVENTDNFSIYGEDIYEFFEGQRGNEFYASFSVSPRRRSPCRFKLVQNGTELFGKAVGFFLCLVCSPCASYNNILQNNVPVNVGPCPCTTGQMDKTEFEESNLAISFFHPGASLCFRSVNPVPGSGSGQQCCYGADGRIIHGPRGGGTADRFSPKFKWWKHFAFDVRPWCGCCHCSKAAADCAKYYASRPSDNCL